MALTPCFRQNFILFATASIDLDLMGRHDKYDCDRKKKCKLDDEWREKQAFFGYLQT